MAITWTSATFEQQPRNLTNPGYGADSIRTGKAATRERGEVEHFWGDNESYGTMGRHREGSAIVFIKDDNASVRETDNLRLSSSRITGQVEIDLLDKATIPEIDEVDITDDRIYNLIISTYDDAGTKVTVFDDSLYVSKDLDQTVTANIDFTGDLSVIAVSGTELVGEEIEAGNEDREKPVPWYQVRAEVNEAFYWNIFDVSDSRNTGYFGLSGSELNVNISANEITANKVYGAVYA